MLSGHEEPIMNDPGPARTPGRAALMVIAFLVAIAAGIGLGALVLGGGDDTAPEEEQAVAGVQTFEVESRNHVEEPVDYEQTPPVGGDHAGTWQNCGFYDESIFTELGVHSLEHGAVWITYQPDLADPDRATIEELAQEDFVLATPWTDGELPAPVVLSAWGAQLAVDDLSDESVAEFIESYAQAETAPEPGAPCTGGYEDPAG